MVLMLLIVLMAGGDGGECRAFINVGGVGSGDDCVADGV